MSSEMSSLAFWCSTKPPVRPLSMGQSSQTVEIFVFRIEQSTDCLLLTFSLHSPPGLAPIVGVGRSFPRSLTQFDAVVR
jgi:hypothetical protein